MRTHAPVVRALLATTAIAWSIDAREPDANHDARLPAQWTDDRGRARLRSGPEVLPLRSVGPGPADGAPRAPRADAA
ncbi:MAG TPA: hypothetical protein VK052_14695 [Zeimonas sp.]|nr:hypothetical protein [Zeimonas sp.]